MIIHAEAPDLTNCIPLAKEFHQIYDPEVEFCEKSFIDFWTAMLQQDGFMLLWEHKDGDIIGGVGGVVTNLQTSRDLVCVEMFWWVAPEFRGDIGLRLFNAFEQEAKERGAKRLLMAYMANSMPEKLERFYRSKGFVPFEYHVVKNL